MGRVIDITDKLTFEEEPKLIVKDVEITVNADAATVLKIMGAYKAENTRDIDWILSTYALLFSDDERAKIDNLKLSFKDFTTLVTSAISLVTGVDTDDAGEALTRTTT